MSLACAVKQIVFEVQNCFICSTKQSVRAVAANAGVAVYELISQTGRTGLSLGELPS